VKPLAKICHDVKAKCGNPCSEFAHFTNKTYFVFGTRAHEHISDVMLM